MAKKPKTNRPAWEEAAASVVASKTAVQTAKEKLQELLKKSDDAATNLDNVQQDEAWRFQEMSPEERISFVTVLRIFPSRKTTNILAHLQEKSATRVTEKPAPMNSNRKEVVST